MKKKKKKLVRFFSDTEKILLHIIFLKQKIEEQLLVVNYLALGWSCSSPYGAGPAAWWICPAW
jgi:hypothetical protein